MNRNALLISLTGTASVVCWWPALIEPSLDFSRWLLLVPIALCAGLSTLLSDGRRRLVFVQASAAGSVVGLLVGFAIWPPSDPIAASYGLFVIGYAFGAAVIVSLVACLAAAKIREPARKTQRALWLALFCGVAVGPVVLAMTPPLVAHRIAHNDGLARARFMRLKSAVEQTMAEKPGPRGACDGHAFEGHYSGPPFSESDWFYISGNAVRQDGYVFFINCQGPGSYTIDARPAESKGRGRLHFCTDNTRVMGCGVEWIQQSTCMPCPK